MPKGVAETTPKPLTTRGVKNYREIGTETEKPRYRETGNRGPDSGTRFLLDYWEPGFPYYLIIFIY